MDEAASKAQLERVIETIAEGIYIVDADGIIIYANKSAEEILGAERSNLIGRPYGDPGYKVTTLEGKPYPPEERPPIVALRTGKRVRDVEYAVIRPDGRRVIVSANAAPIRDDKGKLISAILSFADITTREQVEEDLKESERRFREMLEGVEFIAVMLDTRGNITFANDFLLDLTGWQREDVIGKNWFELFIPPEERQEIKQAFDKLVTKGIPGHYENDILTIEEERRTIAFSNVTLRDRRGIAIGAASIGHDITAEKQATEEISESRKQVLDILESITDGFFALDNLWRFNYVNRRATRLIGKKKEQLLYRDMWEVLPELKGTKFDEEYHSAKEEMVPKTFEAFYPPLNKWFEVHVYPYKNGLSVYISDITERRKTEEALRSNRALLQSIIDNTTAVVYTKDNEGRYILINREYEALFHISKQEIVGKTDYDLLPDKLAEELGKNDQEVLKTGEPIQFEEVIPVEGEPHTYISIKFPLRYPEGAIYGVGGISTDITYRKQAEEALRESEERYRSLVELSPDGIAVHSEGKLIYVNPATIKMFKAKNANELIGKQLLSFVHPDSRQMVIERNKQMQQGKTVGLVEEKFIQVDGSSLDVEVAASPIIYMGKPAIQVVFRDITERKRIEEAFKESENRYRILFEDSPVALWEEDASRINVFVDKLKSQGVRDFRAYFEQHPEVTAEMLAAIKIIDVNRAVLKLYKASSKEEFIRDFGATFTKEGLDAAKEFLIAYAESGEVKFEAEFTTRTLKGDIIDVSVISFIPSGYEETRSKIFIATVDITERKKAEQVLKESEARFRKVFEEGPLGMAIESLDYRFIRVNARLCQMLGYTEEELSKLAFPDVTYPDDIDKDVVFAQRLLRGEAPFYQTEKRYIKKSGESFWVNLTVSVIRDEHANPLYFLTMVEDIEKRKRAEENLARVKGLSDALNSINMTITSTLDFNEIMQRVVIESAKAIGSEAARIFLCEGGYWVLRYQYGVPELPAGTRLTDEEAMTGALASKTRKPVVVNDALHDERTNRMVMETYGIRSLLSVPIIVRGDVVGVLYFAFFSAPVAFTEAQVDFASKLATVISIAIENSRLFEELKRSTEELDKEGKRLQTLLDVALDMASGLKLDELMYKIARNVTELTDADVGAVGLVDEETRAVTYPFIYNLPEYFSKTEVPPGRGMGGVVVSKKKALVLDDYQTFDDKIPQFAEIGLRSIAMVPLWSQGRIIGLLWVSNLDPGEKLDQRALTILEGVSRHAAIALENARRYGAERHIADTLQDALLSVPEKVDHLEYGHFYRSATEAARIGGDFYDLFEMEHNKVGLMVGDVSGKGLEAAALTAVAKNTIRAYALEGYDPAYVMAKTNDTVRMFSDPSTFITAIFAIFDKATKRLTYCNAGHPPAIIKRRTSRVDVLDVYSPIIGAFADLRYYNGETSLDAGEILVLYTDGVIEARSDGTFFEEHRLVEFVKGIESVSAKEVPRLILEEVLRFTGGRLSDDVVVFTLAYKGG